ncbi:hypothetical protein PEBR_32145 [Penicillium brasilianum]|uniref:Disintegrin and metalloproteinase domain-containing protein B n=1 Tax=Penicillium brasilianum TaxID=104259 RepID=A0A1S9RF64_PENBI|nr:hypothetical protein PEBR_32145 [Penicillium brasilianum]
MKKPTLYFTVLALLALMVPISAFEFDQELFRLINPNLSSSNSTREFSITAGIEPSDQSLSFVLENNDDLVSQDVEMRYPGIKGHANEAGAPVRFTRGTVWMHSIYTGSQENVGWARLAVVQDGDSLLFDGAFTIMDVQYAINLETLDDGSTAITAQEHESAFSSSGRSSIPSLCSTSFETHLHKRQNWSAWGGNDNLTPTIGSTSGCPTTRKIANIGIMTDCTYATSFSSTDSAHRYILNMVNTASVVFENSFNISLSVQNLTVSESECPSNSSETTAWNVPCSQGDLNTRLQDFSTWRSSISDDNAYWTLLTGCSVSLGEIGVSWIGALCNTGSGSSNGGASANVVARTQNEWQVFAHESAHTFGAVHDCTSSTCGSDSTQCCPLTSNTCDAGGQYLMNPVSGSGMTRFSPCTIGNVCSRLLSGRVDGRCLVDSRTGNTTDTNERCGNGIVETGESCDCGNGACTEQETRCCDSVTCQLRSGDGCGQTDDGNTGNTGGGTWGNDGSSEDVSSWVQNHLPLVIGLSAGIGGALLLLILGKDGPLHVMQRIAISTQKKLSLEVNIITTEVLIRLCVTSLCGSDLGMALGHMGPVGNILGMKGSDIGQRVGVAWTRDICGVCKFCVDLSNEGEIRCEAALHSAKAYPGTFAEYKVVLLRYLARIPASFDQVPDEEVAPILCGGVTAYKAIKGCHLTPATIDGGLGGRWRCWGSGVAFGHAMEYRVIAVDAGATKGKYCKSQGAENYVDVTSTGDAGKKFQGCTS